MLRSIKQNFFTTSLRHVVPDFFVLTGSLYVSLYLRVGWEEFFQHLSQVHWFIPMAVGVKLLVFVIFGVYNIFWRYVTAEDAFKIFRGVLISSTIIIAISFFISEELGRLPRTVYVIDLLLSSIGILGLRITKRVLNERQHGHQIRQGKKTLVYGAGDLGRILARHFKTDPGQCTHLIGFLDDDNSKLGLSVGGVKVLGNRKDLPFLIEKYSISQVILAATNMSSETVRETIQITRPFNIRPRIVSNTRLLEENHQKNFVIDREIHLSDLLNREARHVDISSVRQMIQGKRVLITGAGGSIGTELSRQVLDHDPSRLLLLDHSELSLYEIDKELRLSTSQTDKVVPLLIDLKDKDTLKLALKEYMPEVILHAAAYKHVHLVEANPFSSILNNVEGTLNLLNIAEEIKVEIFVLISSDKAVNPAGVMGATKRVCELLVSIAGQTLNKNYCSVRFGNVLGSSGSLIPLLKQQIKDGGPITITHPDMNRYFMLIPEAVSLVLKASTISKPGDISVLKMGEPVKIVDIARSLLALSGKTEDDVPIIFTGLRPGEKLYEELYLSGNELNTEHPDILTIPKGDQGVDEFFKTPSFFYQKIESLIRDAHLGKKECIYVLNELVKSNYEPPSIVKEESNQITYLIKSKNQSH